MPSLAYAHTHTHTCGSMGRWMGGVRAGCMPPLLKDSERGGREGSETRLDTLCCSAGELCLFSLERSSTWDRVTHRRHSQPSTHCHTPPRATVGGATIPRHARSPLPHFHLYNPPDNLTCPPRGRSARLKQFGHLQKPILLRFSFKKKRRVYFYSLAPPSFFVCACLP